MLANKKNTIYLVAVKKELEQACAHVGIDVKDGTDILDSFFITLRKFLSDPRLPIIKLGVFGTFQTKYTTIIKIINRAIRSYKINPTNNSYSIFLEVFIKLWLIRKRIFLARLRKSDDINWEKINPETFFVDEGKRLLGEEKFLTYFKEDGQRIRWNKQ